MTGRFKARLTILPGMIGSRGARLAGEAVVSRAKSCDKPISFLRSIVGPRPSVMSRLSQVNRATYAFTSNRAQMNSRTDDTATPAHHGLASEARSTLTTASQARQRSTRHAPRFWMRWMLMQLEFDLR
jgi:hypothetical protein